MDRFQSELLAQLKEHNRLMKELVKLQRAAINEPKKVTTEIFSAVKPKPADSLSINEIVDILIIHGQHDPQFQLGETIKYSPDEIKSILLKEVQKGDEQNA